jgi:hypothetical protein
VQVARGYQKSHFSHVMMLMAFRCTDWMSAAQQRCAGDYSPKPPSQFHTLSTSSLSYYFMPGKVNGLGALESLLVIYAVANVSGEDERENLVRVSVSCACGW